LLIASVWLFSQLVPPVEEPRDVRFMRSCERSCQETRDSEFCPRYCGCMLDTLGGENALDGVFAGDQSAELRARIEEIANLCAAETDNAILEGTTP